MRRSRTVSLVFGIAVAFAVLSASSRAADEAFDAAKLAQMDRAIQRAIGEKRLPGAVLWLESKSGRYHRAFGQRAVVPEPEPMTEDTLFDAASLTKVLVTAPSILLLNERGRLKLDDPVAVHFPAFAGTDKDGVTVRALLTHTSGFGRSLNQEPDWADLEGTLAMIAKEDLARPAGSAFLYSDINFILLGKLVERVSGVALDEFARREIFEPLGMRDTTFRPGVQFRSRVAPTEVIGRRVLRGTVHDFKAQAMGGVAGHAGLFTTAADVARFARMMLNGGELDGVRFLQAGTIGLMTSVQSPPAVESRRGLGWDIDSAFSRPRGEVFPVGSYGHTGFTGVCLWIDPFSKSFWMLLSNRIHPAPAGNIYALQRSLGTLAARAIRGVDFGKAEQSSKPKK